MGAIILALSALTTAGSPRTVRPLLILQGVLMIGVVALGLIALWVPSLVPSVPEPASLPAITVLVVGLAFYGLIALRALHTALLTRRRADLGVFIGLVWLAGALVPALMLTYMDFRPGGSATGSRSPACCSSAPRSRRPLSQGAVPSPCRRP